jgi:chromosomal replication initiation ATPase DnaA
MPRKPNTIKAFSAELNSIIHVRRLTDRQFKVIFNKLTKFIKSCSPGNFDFSKYMRIMIEGCITSDENSTFLSRLKEADAVKESINDPLLVFKLMGAYYSCITEYYPELKIEYVCYEINEVLPDSIMLESLLRDAKTDEEFRKKLEERTTKPKPSGDKKKESLSTLKDILNLESFLKKNIVGQDEAITAVCDAIKLKAAEFSKQMNLFFIGKTGRGKTQLARKLGEKYSKHFWVINYTLKAL